jgi:hydroxyethylthiazole kinase-like uncharacterized protein yjeF
MRELRRDKPGGVNVTRTLLRKWKLDAPDRNADKDARGCVLVVGGSRETPGAAILAATGALRAGAGKLQIATVESVATQLGTAIPEARVIGLPESAEGGIAHNAARRAAEGAKTSDAVLIGPGMSSRDDTREFVHDLLSRMNDVVLVLDAGAIPAVPPNADVLRRFAGRVLLTPHSGEMALLCGMRREEVEDNAAECALSTAREFGAVVALKGATTHIATPEGKLYKYASGDVGLATSGSGDALGGIAVGLAARGADVAQAAVWAVFLHGEAGNALSKKNGRVGYLARELLDAVPPILDKLTASGG